MADAGPQQAKVGRRLIREALQPFGSFYAGGVPDELVITRGSPLAAPQLTMGDCRRAAELLDLIDDLEADHG